MTWATMTKEERIEAIKPLWDAGESATFIGKKLGASRNAVIGYVSRHLPKASHRTQQRAVVRNPKKKATPKQRQKPKHHPWQSTQRIPPKPVEIKPPPELPTVGTVHFIDRLSGQCAFPMWPMQESVGLVCGRAIEGEGSVYCEAHARLCYRSPENTLLGRHVAKVAAEQTA